MGALNAEGEITGQSIGQDVIESGPKYFGTSLAVKDLNPVIASKNKMKYILVGTLFLAGAFLIFKKVK